MAFVQVVQVILIAGLSLVAGILAVLFVIQKAITKPFPVIKRRKEERHFLDPIRIQNVDFPSVEDAPTVHLSVIIPAYNEEQRLPKMLEECMCFLEEKAKDEIFTYEVIVVSDGSIDGTVSLALKYSKRYTVNKFRVLELLDNRGKGGAVRLGMLSARGRYLLFADADGATKFSDYNKLENNMKSITKDWQSDGIVVGSRSHLEQDAIASRSLFRTLLMHGFHFLVWLFAVRSIRDTQCGFKLLTRSSAHTLFKNLHVERWAFDVELLYIAERLKIPIAEVAVNWKEIEGSKLTPVWSWIQMGVDLFLIWFRYTIGAWQLCDQNKEHVS
ncbi:dolichyl-phosphate beta-glucosyltransferase [Bactrocera neohumeralis]|uniref:dolichyl-phosphate beta-glucosyltransferase n=1 Tax=Bactrocera neohumeralis TaxID=98809 RepID=UPI00216529D4|nr:dolichyl-phosphate beta-glucosyltransferase [Bactrocera neohumeralis]